MSTNNTEPMELDDFEFDMENRIQNLLWTVSGDYTLEMKPDTALFLRSKAIALYDGIKQGALARFFDKEALGFYMVKKVYMDADESALMAVAQLCIEEAISDKMIEERPGLKNMQMQALEDIMDQEFEEMPSAGDHIGRLKAVILRDRLTGSEQLLDEKTKKWRDLVYECRNAKDSMDLIRMIDRLYNTVADPDFEKKHGSLDDVLSVTMEELTEFDWDEFMSEELYEDALANYVVQMSNRMTELEDREVTEEMEKKRQIQKKITVVPPEELEKAHTYIELNYGKSYLSETEEKKMNHLMCRGVHEDCNLHFTEGILKNPVRHNYQYEYAKRLKKKNIWLYHDKHWVVKRNIALLTETLQKALVVRQETQEVLSDRGTIVPSRLWRIGRSTDAKVFKKELKGDGSAFVVDVLIDASGSQMKRQSEVALQAYIISEALSNVNIPHRVSSFCTFWNYTVLHRMREYDDPRSANEDIFNYVTSSNNRDGLAIKTIGYGLLQREEEKKILIVLSDGKPYDVLLNRPNAKNPEPYNGKYAITDTATEIRRLRSQEVSVLGVFHGEEKDLASEKKIFGKDFAYIRNIAGFSKIVGRYLMKQLEMDE